jgi:hypothetical protein
LVVGFDLATAHIKAAHACTAAHRGAASRPHEAAARSRQLRSHLVGQHDQPSARSRRKGVRTLATLLRPGGRIALGQSSFVPDMYFAWDARLERLTNEAVRQYYRERYGLDERALADIRCLVGLLRRAQLHNVSVHTCMIERVAPLAAADKAYILEAIFRGTWGERLRPYLVRRGLRRARTRLCDPLHEQFALRRPDFHFLQSFTLAVAEIA